MATSGTYTFAPTIPDIMTEAFSRAGIDESLIKDFHRTSARFSLNLILIDWFNKGMKQWLVEQRTITLTASDATPALDTRTIDILDMVLRRDGVDTPVHMISRKDYLEIPDKAQTGRPDRFWVDRQQAGPVLTLWPVPDNSTDVIIFNQLRRAQDIAKSNSATAAETPDVDILWTDALCAELGKRMSFKFAPKRYDACKADAAESYATAKRESRERGDTTLTVSYRR